MSIAAHARRSRAPPFIDPPGYGRHRPEQTLLYLLVEQHYPAFRELRAAAGRPLPDSVSRRMGPAQSVSGGGDGSASGPGCAAAVGVGR